MYRPIPFWIIVAPAIALASGGTSAPPETVQLTIATLHAAALTTPRGAGDSTDAPLFVVEVIGAQGSSTSVLPDSGALSVRHDGAVGARPLTELSLAAGDSVQVMVSVLENTRKPASPAAGSAPAVMRSGGASGAAHADQASRLVAPLLKDGAHWIGSVSLLLTNESGAIFWRRLDCVASCTVVQAPAATALPAGPQPFSGVVELTGAGGTYHLALRANRAP